MDRKEYKRRKAREWYSKNPERARKNVDRWRRENPGKVLEQNWRWKGIKFTFDEYLDLLQKQNGKCANFSCPSIEPGAQRKFWALDHSHETGKPRGLLCNGCNLILGHSKDDIDVLLGLVEYLKTHGK